MKYLMCLLITGLAVMPAFAADAKKKIVFLPGPPSHGYGDHAHPAQCEYLAKLLNENVPGVEAVVLKEGWPKDPAALDGAAAIVVSGDGGGVIPGHLKELDALAAKGVGPGVPPLHGRRCQGRAGQPHAPTGSAGTTSRAGR